MSLFQVGKQIYLGGWEPGSEVPERGWHRVSITHKSCDGRTFLSLRNPPLPKLPGGVTAVLSSEGAGGGAEGLAQRVGHREIFSRCSLISKSKVTHLSFISKKSGKYSLLNKANQVWQMLKSS